MKNIIVFGGSGFIGGHVVDNLIKKDYRVTVFDRINNNQQYLIPKQNKKINYFFGDIKDKEAVLEAVSKHDGAINLAGILGTAETVNNPYPSVEINILGALNFFEAVRTHKIPAVQITVGNHYMNNSYAITKTTAERFALMYNQEHKTKIAVVRGLNAYGERQKHKPIRKIIPNFILKALRKESINIYGDGTQIMDMIYVKDIAEILVRTLTKDHEAYKGIFEAGTGIKTTVNYIANLVNKLAKNKSSINHLPMRAGEPEKSIVLGDPKTLSPLGALKLTNLEDGLRKTIKWYKKNYPWKQD